MPKLSVYCLASSRPRYMSALPSGTSPLTTCEGKQIISRDAHKNESAYAADLSADRVGAFVGSADHHLVDYDLLGAQNYPDTAHHAQNYAENIITNKLRDVFKIIIGHNRFIITHKVQKEVDYLITLGFFLPWYIDSLLGVLDLEDATLVAGWENFTRNETIINKNNKLVI